MKKVMIMAILAIMLAAWGHGEEPQRFTFVTQAGETIKDAKVVRVEPDGVSFMRASGVVKISFENLPDDLREYFQLVYCFQNRFP